MPSYWVPMDLVRWRWVVFLLDLPVSGFELLSSGMRTWNATPRPSRLQPLCFFLSKNNFYLHLCILRLCLGWKLPQIYFFELRVLCPALIWYNSCWYKSLSKSSIDTHHCSGLQVLLVLSLISPLNDHVVLWVGMVLKFEKKIGHNYRNKVPPNLKFSASKFDQMC